MRTINAIELKKKGISAVNDAEETLVTVRGAPSFVIVRIDKYEALTESELTLAVAEVEAEYKAGIYVTESVDDHIERITK